MTEADRSLLASSLLQVHRRSRDLWVLEGIAALAPDLSPAVTQEVGRTYEGWMRAGGVHALAAPGDASRIYRLARRTTAALHALRGRAEEEFYQSYTTGLWSSNRAEPPCEGAALLIEAGWYRDVTEHVLKWPTCPEGIRQEIVRHLLEAHGSDPGRAGVIVDGQLTIDRRALHEWAVEQGYDMSPLGEGYEAAWNPR